MFAVFLYKSSVWEKCCSIDIGQNTLSHSHYGTFGNPVVARRVIWNWFWPSFPPAVLLSIFLSRHFLGILSLVFYKLCHGAGNPYEVALDRARFSWKVLCPIYFWPIWLIKLNARGSIVTLYLLLLLLLLLFWIRLLFLLLVFEGLMCNSEVIK